MSELVFILASVRPGEERGLSLAQLVFRTIRTGFPTAEIVCHGNGLGAGDEAGMRRVVEAEVGGTFRNLPATFHDEWIERLVETSARPFWIVDPDVVFFECVEGWYRGNDWTSLAGRYEPEFVEPWSQAVHVARLHTCVMYVQPALLRIETRRWQGQFPPFFGWCGMDLIRARFVPARTGPPLYYDTAAGLYQAGIGTPFTAEQDRAFEHLHCGSYGGEIARDLGWTELEQLHAAVIEDPAKAKGLLAKQREWYDERRVRQEN